MITLSCNNICLSYGITTILENITFTVQDCEKVGIVGVNGAGKSSLFKIIAGMIQPDKGDVYISKSLKIGYLQQNSGLESSRSIWEEMLDTYSHVIEMEKRMKILEGNISTEKDQNQLSSLMKEYSLLTEKFIQSGGYEYNSRVKGVLRGLGFTDDQFDNKVKTLSGGQKTRIALAKLLLEEPDILLLDEPTNHLDINAIEWLEDFLKSYRKCVLLISHDRYFLDVVTNKTIELENHQCKAFNGNYSQYIKQKCIDREIQQKHFELQQKEIARMEAFIEQQKRWNREKNIVAAESRQKAIDRIEKIDKPKNLPQKIRVKFKTGIISGNDVLFVENISKDYPGRPLFSNVNFKLRKGERLFLLGPNGCGKSTLLKILAGRLEETSGTFELGHKVVIGYYDQEQEELNESNTILEEVWNCSDKLTHTEIRNALASFLFTGEEVFKNISVLSGGEKSRIALVKLMLSDANLLILDEPTNHLDINSREVLEESLANFDGTLLVVSHDRYFINKLATRVMELEKNSVLNIDGNYLNYLDYKNRQKKAAPVSDTENNPSSSKVEHIASKEEKARQRKVEKQLAETEKEIEQVESRLSSIDLEMEQAFSDHIRLTELSEEKCMLDSRLEKLYEAWEELASEKQSFLNT